MRPPSVSGRSAVGGLIGRNLGTIIDASYATGEASGRSAVGGLIGYEDGNTIRASYATGRVSGETSVGGLGRRVRQRDDHGQLLGLNDLGPDDRRPRDRPDNSPAPGAHRRHRYLCGLGR